ncbi:hypothetical protein PUN28_004272 [Cardiocondyla obscurior]|uniref:Uncharacterized protein n=1 Tax=Cardiocondyla obscurior TaxID=286306 RepID=A0AAW2GBV0_9HYME
MKRANSIEMTDKRGKSQFSSSTKRIMPSLIRARLPVFNYPVLKLSIPRHFHSSIRGEQGTLWFHAPFDRRRLASRHSRKKGCGSKELKGDPSCGDQKVRSRSLCVASSSSQRDARSGLRLLLLTIKQRVAESFGRDVERGLESAIRPNARDAPPRNAAESERRAARAGIHVIIRLQEESGERGNREAELDIRSESSGRCNARLVSLAGAYSLVTLRRAAESAMTNRGYAPTISRERDVRPSIITRRKFSRSHLSYTPPSPPTLLNPTRLVTRDAFCDPLIRRSTARVS